MDARFLGIPFVAWGGLCLAVAAAFTIFWPSAKATSGISTVRYLLLRWGHAAVWGLLALALFLRGLGGAPGAVIAQITALLALVIYFAFLGALLRN
ncbi:MAG: hypothetical protein DCC55_10000 [Chloroflexi bacterium]|nr:MAG: hypothetical protein DCC55_10000 [Chloroflexota bacterium]